MATRAPKIEKNLRKRKYLLLSSIITAVLKKPKKCPIITLYNNIKKFAIITLTDYSTFHIIRKTISHNHIKKLTLLAPWGWGDMGALGDLGDLCAMDELGDLGYLSQIIRRGVLVYLRSSRLPGGRGRYIETLPNNPLA